MQTFVTKIVSLMKDNGLMSWQGGPVILAQVWGPANLISYNVFNLIKQGVRPFHI